MINQRHCPFCKTAAEITCGHLALAAEGRVFVNRCVELSNAGAEWRALCAHRREQLAASGGGASDREDFTWLETAFCNQFLKRLAWFGGMDHEWRSGPLPEQGGFWVLLWSKNPEKLWWELADEIARQRLNHSPAQDNSSWLIPLHAK